MKAIIIAVIALTTGFAKADYTKEITCKTFYQVSWDMPIDIDLSVTLEKTDGKYTMTSRDLDFNVDRDLDRPDWTWYSFVGSSTTPLHFVEKYRPRKYKGHIKFHFDSKLEDPNIEDYNRYFFGSMDLLLPQAELDNAQSADTFKAQTILTYISDHWGGSRSLECVVK